ncbi:MAG TPA: hypothetical protein VHP32_08925 [Ignavibacteria bacterium]|nr:hypothetical protein [Ignavibacteria bacterium]
MKIKFTLFVLFALLLGSGSKSYAQFDKPSFQLSIGISEPLDQLKGGNYYYFTNKFDTMTFSQQLMFIDTNFMTHDYRAKTGININGAAKINFDKYSIVRGVAFASFNSFNTFQSSVTGNTLTTFSQGTSNVFVPASVTFNYSLSVFSLGVGLEIAPTSFTNLISPFFGANVSMNFINAELERTSGSRIDTPRVTANGTRFGANLTGGIEFKINPQFGIMLGAKYDMANLLGKGTNQSMNDPVIWGSSNASLNDENGPFYSNVYLPMNLAPRFTPYQAQDKKINWLSFFVGVNFYPSSLTGKK